MMVESSPAFTVSEVPIPHVYSVVQKIPACLNLQELFHSKLYKSVPKITKYALYKGYNPNWVEIRTLLARCVNTIIVDVT